MDTNNTTFIIILLLFIFFFSLIKDNSLEQFGSEYYNPDEKNDDLLLTRYFKGFISTKFLDNLPKHIRLNHGGGIMYISNSVPRDQGLCITTPCPSLIKDDLTPKGQNNGNLTCWECY